MLHNYLQKSLVSLGLSSASPLVNGAADKAFIAVTLTDAPGQVHDICAMAAWAEEDIEKMS